VGSTTSEANNGTWWSFTVGSGGPPPPSGTSFSKTGPANGVAGLASTVTLSWTSAGDAGYWVCVTATSTNSCNTSWQAVGGGTSRPLTGLASGTYYWQVRAQVGSAVGEADSGTWWSFTVGSGGPPPPSGVSFSKAGPASGASGLSSVVTLSWTSAGDAGYWVCITTTSTSACDTSWQPAGGGTTRPLTGLAPGTYYWQVRAQVGSATGEADNGTWWNFTVGGEEPLTLAADVLMSASTIARGLVPDDRTARATRS
jgi:hypothetical protein